MFRCRTVFVDMDGVVADFVGGVFKHFNFDASNYNPRGDYDLTKYLDIPTGEFWSRLDTNETFWESLEPTPEAFQLMELLESRVPSSSIYFLSSPALHPNCFHGKAVWVHKHFPEYISRLILTQHKHFLAAQDRLLVDDNNGNINSFRDSRGRGVLFPRPWNSLYSERDRAFEVVSNELLRFL